MSKSIQISRTTNLPDDRYSLPENYEIYFSQVSASYSIFYAKPEDVQAELMVGGFRTKEDAIEYLLFP